jgi:hypothetical protein
VVLAMGQFEIMAMNTSAIIINEVHGLDHSTTTVCSSNSDPNIYSMSYGATELPYSLGTGDTFVSPL